MIRTVCRALVIMAALNFCAFWYGTLIFGGSAPNGKRAGDRYFLGEHGRYAGVSESVYNYSRLHVASLFITHPIGMIAALVLLNQKDPFLVQRNKRRDRLFFGLGAASLLVGVLSRYPTFPFWLFPVFFMTFLGLDLRDAIRHQRGDHLPN